MTIYDKILSASENTDIKIVTFDIFDTLVFRHVGLPTDVFEHIPVQDIGLAGIDRKDYRILREQAERIARQRFNQTEDIAFESIFACMPFSENVQRALAKAELEIERTVSIVNPKMVDLIRKLMSRGLTVSFISDMYFSAQQIRDTFFSTEPELRDLPLYVSSETGKTKFSGSMFSYLADKLGWEPKHWLHVGDNADADIKSANATGIQTCRFHPSLDSWSIRHLEKRQFLNGETSSAVRLLASMNDDFASSIGKIAYDTGAFVWGPVMETFADWIIEQTQQTQCKHILCLMREGYLFAPIVEKRLSLRGITDIQVSRFYVSRKSAFWPGIDTSKAGWLDTVMDTLMTYRGYTLQNFVDDFHADPALCDVLSPDLPLKNIEGIFIEAEPLYQRLRKEAMKNESALRQRISQQRALLSNYLSQLTSRDYSECAVVDFGNGGTIQHSLEQIFSTQAGANLLFYSSLRAYRFVDKTLYRAFISVGNEKFRLSERLSRSPECIEALLLGEGGSTLYYETCGSHVKPVTAEGIIANKEICSQFLSGCLSYIETAFEANHPRLSNDCVQAVVARYLLMPTREEAALFEHLLHQDNFGTDGEYPVIDDEQKERVRRAGLKEAFIESGQSNRWELGEIHWPAGVIALEDETFLTRVHGLLENDNKYYIEALIDKLLALGWQNVTIYGAGEFFLQALPLLKQHRISLSHVVDRRAGSAEGYQVAGYDVVTLDTALDEGANYFVITSHAFREEIADTIAQAAAIRQRSDLVMVSV